MPEQNIISFQLLESINTDINNTYEIKQNPKTKKDELKVDNSVGQLNFSYESSSNHFIIQTIRKDKINENITLKQGMTLVTFIEKQQQLSLIQVFLWKYRQNYFPFDEKLNFIIIQANFATTDMSSLWSNIGCLSAHMGFEVQSSEQAQNKQIFNFHENIQVYHQSQYPSFDTLQIKSEKFRFSMSVKNDTLLYQCLLTQCALDYSKKKECGHILPIQFAINAITLEHSLQQDGQKVQFSIIHIMQAQQIYDTGVQPDSFVNVFHIPVHLIQLFYTESKDIQDKQNCFIEFQQMCDVSYYNKVEFICLARNFYRNENSVISFSSRSGKSTTLYSLYYYNLFSQKTVPVYINLSYCAPLQPLYKRTSFEFTITKLINQLKGAEYFEFYYHSMNDVLERINQSALWSQKCLQNLVENNLDLPTNNSDFEKLTVRQIFDGLLAQQFFQLQEKREQTISNDELQLFSQWIIEKLRLQKTKIQDLDIELVRNNINLYIDECLTRQNEYYNPCVDIIVTKCKLFYKNLNRLLDQNIISDIFKVTGEEIDITGNPILIKKQGIKCWEKILFYNKNSPKFNISDASSIIQQLEQQLTLINETTEEEKYYILFNYWYIYYEDLIKPDSCLMFIDDLIIESPQFPNIKKRKDILLHLLEEISKLKYDQFKEQLDYVLFQFFMSLYNPRGIETMFWKNIQYYFRDNQSTFQKSFLLNQQSYYNIDSDNNQDIQDIINIYQINQVSEIHQNQCEPLNIRNRILVAGTDFSLINFVRQNQLCYNTESSRTDGIYISTSIISPAQPHPTIISKFYYKLQRVSIANNDYINTQIKNSVLSLSFHQYYTHMIPEKASEMQILCSLISPQIFFNNQQTPKQILIYQQFLLNQSKQFQSIRSIDTIKTKVQQYQMYLYKQTYDQILIQRCKEVKFNQLSCGTIQVTNYQNSFDLDIKNFHKNIVFLSSSIYNQEIAVIFNYEMSNLFFKDSVSDKLQTYLNQEQKIFSWSSLNECNCVLLFVLKLIGNKAAIIFESIRNQTQQKLFLSFQKKNDIYFQDYPSDKIWDTMKRVCKNMKFMFQQQSYDEFIHFYNTGSDNILQNKDKQLYLQQARKLAIESFKILLNNKKFILDKQLVIITVIDKQLLKTLFSISDYLLTIISDKSQLLDSHIFKKTSFTCYFVEGEVQMEKTFYTYQIFIEYGIHQNRELGKKLYMSDIKSIIQIGLLETNIELNRSMEEIELLPFLENQIKVYQKKANKIPDSYVLKDLQYLANNLSFEQQKEILNNWVENQHYLINYITTFNQITTHITTHVFQNINSQLFDLDNVEQQFKSIIESIEELQLPLFIYNIVTDTKTEVIFIDETETKLNQLPLSIYSQILQSLGNQVVIELNLLTSSQIILYVISGDDIKNIDQISLKTEKEIINTEQIIIKWVKNQVQVVNYIKKFQQLTLTKNCIGKIDLLSFYHQVPVYEQINVVIIQAQTTLNIEQIKIELYDLENVNDSSNHHSHSLKDLSVYKVLDLLADFVILKSDFQEDQNRIVFTVVSIKQTTDSQVELQTSIVEEPEKTLLQKIDFWRSNYDTTSLIDPKKSLIENYIKIFNSIDLTEEIADLANPEFFDDKLHLTVEMQIEQIFRDKDFVKIVKDKQIQIVFSDKEKESLICECSFEGIISCVGGSVIIDYEIQPKSKVLKLFIIK